MAPVEVTYPPLDVPKPVADRVWIVDSGPHVAFGLPLPLRMTAIRLSGGDLLLHSPTRLSPALKAALELIGPIRHIVVPSVAHWMYARDWQRALPDATTWAAPGVRERGAIRKAGLQVDRVLGPGSPEAWAGEIAVVAVPGAAGFIELVLFHEPSRTMVFTDLVQNLDPEKLPRAARLIIRALGGAGPDARPPVYLRAIVRLGGSAARDAARRLIAMAPERLIVTHGEVITRDATERLRRSLGWLVQ